MGMISEKDKEYLRKMLSERMKDEARVLTFTQETECLFCKETRELVQEVAALTDKIKVEVYDFVKDSDKAKQYNVDKIPAITVIGEKDYGVRFFGIPSGYEFSSFIEAVVDVSAGHTHLSEEAKVKLRQVNKPVHIQVFVTPTCPYCPMAVRVAHQFAVENLFVRADMVESMEFPHLAQKYGVMSVPKTVINEKVEFVGAVPEEQFAAHVLEALK